jgi:hypothetical protein
MKSETDQYRDVRLPVHLYEAVERLVQGTTFGTVEEFLAFVLGELTSADSAAVEERERKVIEQRLRDLGYL